MFDVAKLSFSGVDYIRLTANDHKPYEAWREVLEPEFTIEDQRGRKPHWRWVLGYYGRVGEHCFVGKGEQGAMIQVSSGLANHLCMPVSRIGGKCSRIDLQLTVPAVSSASQTLHEAFVMASAVPKRNGHPTLVQMRDTNYGARMLEIGSRQSEVYGRIYDKYAESKMEEYRGMVRYEIEVKQPQSVDLHRWLMEDRLTMFNAKHITTEWFRKRGVPVFWDDYELKSPPDIVKRTKNDDTKVSWLASQVRPSVKELCAKGKALEVAKALAGQGATEDAIMELARVLAIVVHD